MSSRVMLDLDHDQSEKKPVEVVMVLYLQEKSSCGFEDIKLQLSTKLLLV